MIVNYNQIFIYNQTLSEVSEVSGIISKYIIDILVGNNK